MKKIFIYISIAAAALALQGCIEDSRENYMVDDSVGLAFKDPVIQVSVYSGSQSVTVLKAGKGKDAGYVQLDHGSEALAAYNADDANYTKYKEIRRSMVSYSADKLQFAAEDVRQSIDISWDPEVMVTVLNDDSHVIPVTITGSDLAINENRRLILLNVLNSTASFASSGSTITAKESASENSEIRVKFKLDHPLPKDITIRYAVDNSLVAAYNAEKGTEYTQAPAGYLGSGETVIKAGATDVFTDITLKTSALFQSGVMMDFRTHVIPVKITGTDISGVKISDSAYYLLVNSPYAGPSFSRIWGRFSTESLWTAAYGLAEGVDRNLTVDKEWVYVPYAVGGATAKILAISVNDPETTKEVNCTGFQSTTITSACVRVIDKGDGTTMLTAAGASEEEGVETFPFYFWKDGIDNPPQKIMLQRTWRRSADRYEFHGTWADGVLYTVPYLGRFAISYKVKDGEFVSTNRTLVDMLNLSGFGGLYAYPGQDQMLFTSHENASFVTLSGSTYSAGDGQMVYNTDKEPYPGGDMSWGYRCFTYRGDKYIAYTTIDREDDTKEDGITTYTTMMRARLVVVKDKGGFKASLLGDNKDIVFEAPLQGEEFTSISMSAPKSIQGDCAVMVMSDKVFIAAGVQIIGTSLFKME